MIKKCNTYDNNQSVYKESVYTWNHHYYKGTCINIIRNVFLILLFYIIFSCFCYKYKNNESQIYLALVYKKCFVVVKFLCFFFN